MFAIRVNIQPLNRLNVLHHLINSSVQTHLDLNYICDERNVEEIAANIKQRKGVGNIHLIHDLKQQIAGASNGANSVELQRQLLVEVFKIPNKTHPCINFSEPKEIYIEGKPRHFKFKPRDFHEITKRMHLARTEHLGNVVGTRSYFLYGALAALEQALIKYTLHRLKGNGFKLISVPDIVDRASIQCSGMDTDNERTQVYALDEHHGKDLCLSGTAEMAITTYFANKTISNKELPLKLCAVSRCFRAETSSVIEERGIFRVHQFNKVEMFAVTEPSQSDSQLEEFRSIEEKLFSELGLHFKTLDMPAHELGAAAYRKYDIEAWMPGRNMFGEISSCSNCTDYQSRRFGTKLHAKDGTLQYPHTINGTACAIPRMLIALIENYQNDNGIIDIPVVLQPFYGSKNIVKQGGIPSLKLAKYKSQTQ